jgi:ComF family protein
VEVPELSAARPSLGSRAAGRAKGATRGLLDLQLPPRCLACGAVVAAEAPLCPACWPKLTFLAPPFCACCGLPFAHDLGAGALCGGCAARAPAFQRARAVFRYDDASRGLILAFKHGDRLDAVPAFARWLAGAGAALLAEADLVVPVPLHRRRLFQRRYNQAALLAQALARRGATPVATQLLLRRRNTPSQGHLRASQRRRNVAGAFAVAPGGAARLAGLRVLLVDDVFTTGATLEAAARPLLAAGARQVDCLTLARVVLAST